jgi:hypothetical protein
VVKKVGEHCQVRKSNPKLRLSRKKMDKFRRNNQRFEDVTLDPEVLKSDCYDIADIRVIFDGRTSNHSH